MRQGCSPPTETVSLRPHAEEPFQYGSRNLILLFAVAHMDIGMKREFVVDTATFAERQREFVRNAAKELAKLKILILKMTRKRLPSRTWDTSQLGKIGLNPGYRRLMYCEH